MAYTVENGINLTAPEDRGNELIYKNFTGFHLHYMPLEQSLVWELRFY